MKKKLLIALFAITAAICGAFGFAACDNNSGGSTNGTYYKLEDGKIDKKTYFVIDSGEWKDEDGESGTYKKDGDKIIFYIEFFGSKEEAASGTIKDGVLIMDEGGYKQSYISSSHKHKYGDWKTTREVTCTIDGLEERSCQCGVKESKTIKCVGHHTGNWKTEKEATCIKKGLKTIDCTVCKKHIEEEIDYADHEYGKWQTQKEATCTEKGLRIKICEVCEKEVSEEIDMLEHKLSYWHNNETTHYKTCSMCKQNFETAEHDSDNCTICGYPFEFDLNKTGYTLKSFSKNLTTAEIPASFNGKPVNYIGNTAFYGCSSLISITIPDSVTNIGYSAFYNCSSLTSITIPDGITSIGKGAFGGCSSLTNVTMGNGLTSIGENAFKNCSSLTSITIPDSVTSIGSYAFDGCDSLSEIKFKDMASFCKIYGLGNVDKSKVFIGGQKLTEMTSIVIPDGVTSIGYDAFSYCSSLTSITFPDGVTAIGGSAFSGCSSLTSVSLPDSVTSIGDYAFSGCSLLTSITIPDSVTSIGRNAFSGCSSLTIYCEATEEPSSWRTFWNSYYSSATHEKTCPVVWNCKNNEKDKYGNIYTVIDGIRYSLNDGIATVIEQPSNITTANIPVKITYKNNDYSVTGIGSEAFMGCSSLTSVTIPDSVTSIGERAFSGCDMLTSITIPDSVTSIGDYAFGGCSLLIIYCEATGISSIYWSMDWNNSSCPVVWNCQNNDIASNGYIYTVIDGIRYSFKNGIATVVKQPKNITTATILAKVTYKNTEYEVTSIGEDAFRGCNLLTSVTIGNGVKSIGECAFSSCSSLKNITIPDSVTEIGWSAFSGCSSLTSITFNGTKWQWNAITKGSWWNDYTGNYTIYCTDGDISK